MKLYVGNCSQQAQVVNYRIIEFPRAMSQPCDMGQQIMIARADLSLPQIEDFIKQMRIYGLLTVEEISALRDTNITIPFIAAIDKPIPAATIEKVMYHNRGVLQLRGKKLREEAAMATSLKMSEMTPGAAQTLEMTIQEEKSGSLAHDDAVNEGLRIGSGNETPAQVRNKSRRR
jgi:hypothetical protein